MERKSVKKTWIVILAAVIILASLFTGDGKAYAARGKNGLPAPEISLTVGDNGAPKIVWRMG